MMLSVLLDARANHDLQQIEMPKNVVVIDPNGSKINVSQYLMPLNSGKERSNRPKICVEETNDSFIYSLCDRESCDTAQDLEQSLHKMSLDDGDVDSFDLSISSASPPELTILS